MKTWILFLMFAIAAVPVSAGKPHMKTEGQECAECHNSQEQVWLNGKHGLMNVKCVVCHGSPEETFTAKPGITKCRGCHSDKVMDVEKKLMGKERTCFLCHDNHTVAVKAAASSKSGFHVQGGIRQ